MLINVQDVKEFLGIAVTTDDNIIMAACQAAQDDAENKVIGGKLEGSTFIEFIDGDGTDIIQLRNAPIKSVTSIYDDIDRVYASDSLVAAEDYIIDAGSGIIYADGFLWGIGRHNLKITYLAGYNPIGSTAYTALPYDLKLALVQLSAAMYLEGKAGVQVFENQEIVYRPSYLRKEAYKVFAQYRRMSL